MNKKTIFILLATIAVSASSAFADTQGNYRPPVQQDNGGYDAQPVRRGVRPPLPPPDDIFNRPLNLSLGMPTPIRVPLVGDCILKNPYPGELSGRLYINNNAVGDFYTPSEKAALRVLLSVMWGVTGTCRVVSPTNF